MDVFFVFVAFLALALGALSWAARAAVTICELSIVQGRVHVRRGGLAPRILSDLGDVAARAKIGDASVRIVRDGERARLEIRGQVSAAAQQQLRNVVGSVPLAKLTNRRR